MLGEMPSLLVSSNIVDGNIARAAMMTENTNISIPPFKLQDDTPRIKIVWIQIETN